MFLTKKILFLIDSCKKNSQSLPHILLVTSDSSVAKRLANNIASMMNSNFVTATGAELVTFGNLANVLTNLGHADIFFVDEISNINKSCYQSFEGAIENFIFNIPMDTGLNARIVQLKLNKFTLVATVPKITNLNRKLLGSFFCIMEEVDMIEISSLSIIEILKELNVDITQETIEYFISLSSKKGIDLESFVRKVVKFLQISEHENKAILTCEAIDSYLEFSGIQNFKEESSCYRTITPDVKREVWRRDEGMCVLCRSQERLEFDHIIPFSKGGSNTVRNIQLLCEDCNRAKGAKI